MTTIQYTQPPTDKHDTTTHTHTDNHLIITHSPIFNLLSSTTLLQPTPTPTPVCDAKDAETTATTDHQTIVQTVPQQDTHKKIAAELSLGHAPNRLVRQSDIVHATKKKTQTDDSHDTDHIDSRSPMEIADGRQPTRKGRRHRAKDKQFLI